MATTEVAAKPRAVSVENVVKIYQRDSQQIKVLDGLSLDVPQGEFMALMGPSGSGKTTLLNLIAGIDRATSGSVAVAGTDLTPLSEGELAKWRSRNVGFIFQFYNLIPVLNAVENVELPLLLSRSVEERAARTRPDGAAHRGTGGQVEALSSTALGRAGAASCHRARDRDRSVAYWWPTSRLATWTARAPRKFWT